MLNTIGIIGNIITITIFSRKELRSTFHASLSVLSTFDLGLVTVTTIDAILQLVDINGVHGTSYPDTRAISNKTWLSLYPYVLWPFENIFMTASIFMTVIISIDR